MAHVTWDMSRRLDGFVWWIILWAQ